MLLATTNPPCPFSNRPLGYMWLLERLGGELAAKRLLNKSEPLASAGYGAGQVQKQKEVGV